MSSKSSSESIENKIFGVTLKLLGEEFLEIVLGDVGFSFMKYVKKDLFPREDLVDSESSGSDSDGHK